MGRYALIEIDLSMAQAYIKAIRSQGQKSLEKRLKKDAEVEKNSTAFLSWCKYQLPRVDIQKNQILNILELDLKDPNGGVCQDIFSEFLDSYLTDPLLCKKKVLFEGALKIIETIEPQLFRFHSILKPRLSIPGTNFSYESISDPKIFSQIYFSMTRETVMGWAEIMSHELAHQYLFVIYSARHKNINAPWKSSFFSAIRNSYRPLIGIFHGVMAESFMIHLSKSVLNETSFSIHHREAFHLLKTQTQKLKLDFTAINKFKIQDMDPTIEVNIQEAYKIAKDLT